MSDKSDVARQATFVASKVSERVFEVDTMKAKLEAGDFKIGAGKTPGLLQGKITPGQKLPGLIPIADDNALLLHDKSLKNWKEAYTKYVGLSKLGALILAGDAEGFSLWAKSKAGAVEHAFAVTISVHTCSSSHSHLSISLRRRGHLYCTRRTRRPRPSFAGSRSSDAAHDLR